MFPELTAHILIGLLLGWWWQQHWPVWGLVIGITLGFASGIFYVWKKYPRSF